MSDLHLSNFINNEFQQPQGGDVVESINPYTKEVNYTYTSSSALDVALAAQSAQKASEKWWKLGYAKRGQYLLKLKNLLQEKASSLAEQETRDTGKVISESLNIDLKGGVRVLEHYIEKGSQMINTMVPSSGKQLSWSEKSPLGVVSLIIPWNFPLYLLIEKLAPALISGNTVIVKPSSQTCWTSYSLAELILEAGFPKGVVNFVFGGGEDLGELLVQHPAVKGVSFTGSTETGKKIYQWSSSQFKKLQLEMGGKNAMIILKDSDLETAVKGAVRSCYTHQGQVCIATSRIYVQQEIYEEFKESFKKQVSELKVGDPLSNESSFGPLMSEDRLKIAQSFYRQCEEAGGQDLLKESLPKGEGYYMAPALFEDVNECSDLYQTEFFSPIALIQPFKYAHEAIKRANISPYGLTASLWTKDLARALKLVPQIQVGRVWVNQWMSWDFRLPFAGIKHSGLGIGAEGDLGFFSNQKSYAIRL